MDISTNHCTVTACRSLTFTAMLEQLCRSKSESRENYYWFARISKVRFPFEKRTKPEAFTLILHSRSYRSYVWNKKRIGLTVHTKVSCFLICNRVIFQTQQSERRTKFHLISTCLIYRSFLSKISQF